MSLLFSPSPATSGSFPAQSSLFPAVVRRSPFLNSISVHARRSLFRGPRHHKLEVSSSPPTPAEIPINHRRPPPPEPPPPLFPLSKETSNQRPATNCLEKAFILGPPPSLRCGRRNRRRGRGSHKWCPSTKPFWISIFLIPLSTHSPATKKGLAPSLPPRSSPSSLGLRRRRSRRSYQRRLRCLSFEGSDRRRGEALIAQSTLQTSFRLKRLPFSYRALLRPAKPPWLPIVARPISPEILRRRPSPLRPSAPAVPGTVVECLFLPPPLTGGAAWPMKRAAGSRVPALWGPGGFGPHFVVWAYLWVALGLWFCFFGLGFFVLSELWLSPWFVLGLVGFKTLLDGFNTLGTTPGQPAMTV